jgi:hypothetical protein
MHLPFFPEEYKIVMLNSNTAANAVACDYVSLKNVSRFYWLVLHTLTNDTDLVLTPKQATAVAGTGAKATSAVHRIWVGANLSTSVDDWVEATAAASYTIDPATQNPCYLLIEVDPAIHLDVNGGFDCVLLDDSGGHASNFCTILGIAAMKDQGEGVLTKSLITD